MGYYLKRIRIGVAKRRRAIWLALAPALLYLGICALVPYRFEVRQQVTLPPAAKPASALAANPGEFFREDMALLDRMSRLKAMTKGGNLPNATRMLIQETMSLKAAGGSAVEIAYQGSDCDMGTNLVSFYAQRLLAESGGAAVAGAPAVQSVRVAWRLERFSPALIILAASLALMLAVLIALEWSDHSLKTVRQAARYLDLPVFGTLPDVNVVSQTLKIDSSGPPT
jgi:hypothetical protein